MQQRLSDSYIIKSAVHPTFKKKKLYKSFFFAFLGASFLLYSAITFSLEDLKTWGFPLFAFSFLFLSFGLIPLQRLKRIEENPHSFVIQQKGILEYKERGALQCSFPISEILSFHYIETKHGHGIGLNLRQPIQKKIIVHNPNLNMNQWGKKSFQKYKHHFFFPYFSKKGCKDLQSFLESQTPD